MCVHDLMSLVKNPETGSVLTLLQVRQLRFGPEKYFNHSQPGGSTEGTPSLPT